MSFHDDLELIAEEGRIDSLIKADALKDALKNIVVNESKNRTYQMDWVGMEILEALEKPAATLAGNLREEIEHTRCEVLEFKATMSKVNQRPPPSKRTLAELAKNVDSDAIAGKILDSD